MLRVRVRPFARRAAAKAPLARRIDVIVLPTPPAPPPAPPRALPRIAGIARAPVPAPMATERASSVGIEGGFGTDIVATPADLTIRGRTNITDFTVLSINSGEWV